MTWGGEGVEPEPGFDARHIAFPLDRVTWGEIRCAAINADGELRRAITLQELPSGEEVVSAHTFELELAVSAFHEGLGQGPVMSKAQRRQTIELIEDVYMQYGLSTGRHQTEELVRAFTDAARAQGAAMRGRLR